MTKNKKILGLLGLSARAGSISFGTDSTIAEIDKNKIKLVIVATDASERTKRKFINKCEKSSIPIIEFGLIEEISKSIGKQNKAIIGVKDYNMAREIEKINRGDVNG